MDVMKIENIKELILEIRGQRVIIDKDVAEIYGVETKRVNEAAKIIRISFQMIISFR